MTPPLISVLIPAWNARATLAETLDSVLAQTYPRVETIVVVDGSPDGTLDVARQYEDRGVKVFWQENAGASAARNHAFRKSTGAFIQFLDADDILAPDKLAVQMERLANEPEGTVASCRWALFSSADRLDEVEFQADSLDWRDYDRPTDWLVDSWLHRKLMFPGVWLYPRSVVEKAGPWDERLSLNDDGEFNTRVLPAARRIAFCRGARVYYRAGGPQNLSWRKDFRSVQSLFLSYVLAEQALLDRDSSKRARLATARRWREFSFDFYLRSELRPMVRYADARARQLGDFRIRHGPGSRYALLERIVGWKAALRAQRVAKHLGLQRPVRSSS